jgi:hypothetical protein
MKLRERIPVEQLDDERLTNIERSLVVRAAEIGQAPVRSRARLAWVGTALAVAIAAVIGWKLHRPEPPAPEVAQTFAIETHGDRQEIELSDATIASAPATRVDVRRTSRETVITMARGTLDLAIVHRPERRFVIRAGDTEIEDIGTKLSIAFDGSTVKLRVTEGEVSVTRQQRTEHVSAGHAWSTDGGVVALVDPPAPSSPLGPVAPVGPQPEVVAGLERAHIASTPVAPVAPPARPRRAVANVESAPVLGEHVEHRAHAAPPADPYVDLQQAIRRQPIEFDPHIDGKTDAASQIGQLKKLAYVPPPAGAEASAALYEIAVLLHRPLGQDVEALHTLDMYQRRFAGGREKHAALWLRVRIVCGHAIDDDCRKAAYTYQHEVPSGNAADVAIRITNAQ